MNKIGKIINQACNGQETDEDVCEVKIVREEKKQPKYK